MSAGQNGTLRSLKYRNWHLKICVCTSGLQLWSWDVHGRAPFVFPPCLRRLYLSAHSGGGGKEESAMLCSWAPVLLPAQSDSGAGERSLPPPPSAPFRWLPFLPRRPYCQDHQVSCGKPGVPAALGPAGKHPPSLTVHRHSVSRLHCPRLLPGPLFSWAEPHSQIPSHSGSHRVLLNLAYSLIGNKGFPTLATRIP